MANFQGTDGDDRFAFPANVGNDDIEGAGGNDTLLGGAGDDHVDGDDGNDVVDGGAGADRVRGQRGDDLGDYVLAENTRSPGLFFRDVYDGGRGSDTLRLHFSSAEFWALQSNIVALESFILSHQDTSSSSTDSDVTFKTSFGLEARNWERLEVFVDGQRIDPRDPPPFLDLDANDGTAAGTACRTAFVEGSERVAVVDADVRVVEAAGQRIDSATLTILVRPDGAAETLELSEAGEVLAVRLGVTVEESQPQSESGPFVLTLTGEASAADYEALLRAVGYRNSSQDPHEGDRLVQVVVSDGSQASAAAWSHVTAVGVNDPPENAFPGALGLLEDERVLVAGRVSDPDAGWLRVTLEVEHGTLTLATTDSVEFFEGDGSGDRRIVIEGTPGDLNQGLAGLVYAPDPDFAESDRLAILTDDLGRQGSGGSRQDLDHVELSVVPVNDRPSLALSGDRSIDEDAGVQTVSGFALAEPGGGRDEAGQTFTFLVSNDNAHLFSWQPEIDASGTLLYAPAPEVSGTATVQVNARDSGGSELGTATSPTRTFTITVEPVADKPTLILLGDQIVLEESGTRTVSGFASAYPGGGVDERDQTFEFSVDVDDPELFAVGPAIDSRGKLSFTPNEDSTGTTSVRVTATDSGGSSSSERFQITINPVNDRPTLALAGNATVAEDSRYSRAGFAQANPGGGLDERGQDFFYTVRAEYPELFVEAPAISPGGRLTFTPALDAWGTSTVTVQVTDDGGTADGGEDTSRTQTFTINVKSVNDAAVLMLHGGDPVTIEDSPEQTVPGFATALPGGGPDEAGQGLAFRVVPMDPSYFARAPAIDRHGTLTYTPAPDAVGTARVLVSVTDTGGTWGGGSNTSAPQGLSITIHPVNDRPTLALRGDQSVLEDAGPQEIEGFAITSMGGGKDEATQTCEYTVSNDKPWLFALAPTISPDGMLRYQTNPDLAGTATVTVIATDSGGTVHGGRNTSLPASFTISVNPVNDASEFTLRGNQSVLEDAGSQTVAGFAVANSGGGPDEESQTFAYRLDTDRPDLFRTGPSVSPTGILTYTPNPDAAGTAKVSIQLSDSGGNAGGGAATSAVEVFTITINPVNDRPSLGVGGDQILDEDSGLYSMPGFARPNPGGGLDERSQGCSYEVTTDRDDLFASGPQIDDTGRLVFKTQADRYGVANVSVWVIDDGGVANGGQNRSDPAVKFRIVVNPVNDAPTLALLGDRIAIEDSGPVVVAGFVTADAGGGETGQAFTYHVTTDGRELFASAPTIASDGTLIFTPQRDATGTATVRVTATDSGGTANGGESTSAAKLFAITLNPVNDKPSVSLLGDCISNEDAGVQGLWGFATASPGGGWDEAAQTFNYNVTTQQPWLFQTQPTIARDGTLSYAMQKDMVGTANVTVTVTDSGGTANGGRNVSDPQTFSITVNPVNDAPGFSVLGNQITVEDAGPRSVAGFARPQSGGGPDEAGQGFFYNVVSTNPQLFAAAPVISPGGVLTYLPAADASGVATVLVSVSDSGGRANGGQDTSELRAFSITVNSANDSPVLVVGGDQIALEDSRAQVATNFAHALPGGGPDEVGQSFSYQVSTNALDLFAVAPTIDGSGRLSYQPKPDAVGTALVQVVAVDDGGTANGGNPFSNPRTFAIRIGGVNDAPLLTLTGNRIANEDAGPQVATGFARGLPGGGVDEQGQTFSYDVRTDALELFAEAPAISPTGALTFMPARDAIGIASVEVALIDNGGTANGGQNRSLAQTFTIALAAVNDPPVVTLLGNRSELEDSSARMVPHFATANRGGGSDEATQSVVFSVVENDNPDLFALAPSIDALGNLSYTLNHDAAGTARLKVVGTDSGGTANGGVPVSAAVPFTLTVNPVNDRPSLSLKGTQVVNEDAGRQTVLHLATSSPGGGADESGQAFSYSVTTNNPWLFAAGPSITPEGHLTYTPQRDTIGNAELTVTVTDSGGTGNGGESTSLPATFWVAVNPVNDPPAFALLGDQTVLEDGPAQVKTGFAIGNPGGGPDESLQRFSYSVSHDNPQLFKVAPQISDSGTLTYEVHPDLGDMLATVSVVAADNGGTANGGAAVSAIQTFRVAVSPVNDAPTFALLGGDQVIFEDAAPQSVARFATAHAGGGADERGQTFSYTTLTDRPDLFAKAPAIDPSGMLTYTPKVDAFGLATVTAKVSDSGSTAHGGVDTSYARTFTIFIDPINDAPVNQVPGLVLPTEDQQFWFASQNGGRISVSDSDAQALEISLSVAAGKLTVTTSVGFELSSREFSLAASPEALNQLLAGLRYTPNPDFYGTDRLAIVVRDQGERGAGGPLQDVDTVTLSVQGVNDAPFVSVPGPQLASGGSLVFSAGNSNRITIEDSDAGTSDLAATLFVANGTLSVELEGLRFSGDRLALTADLAALNDALDGLVYAPDPGTSHDRLELRVDDLGNTGRGGALSHTATVDILLTEQALGLVGVPEGAAGDLPG